MYTQNKLILKLLVISVIWKYLVVLRFFELVAHKYFLVFFVCLVEIIYNVFLVDVRFIGGSESKKKILCFGQNIGYKICAVCLAAYRFFQ